MMMGSKRSDDAPNEPSYVKISFAKIKTGSRTFDQFLHADAAHAQVL
jgi:hypothetical protein